METLKDFFSDLKDRISNPFISSFIIAWIFFNYTILIALFFYKQAELKTDGYSSYLDLIHQCYNVWNMVWYPLIVAFIYTFIVPFFKSIIKVFQAWVLTTTDGIIYRITKQKVVSVELHTEVLRNLDETKAQYVNLINSGGSIKSENEQLKVSIHELNNSHAKFIKDLNVEHDGRLQTVSEEENDRYHEMQSSENRRYETLKDEYEGLMTNYNLANKNLDLFKSSKNAYEAQKSELSNTYEKLNDSEEARKTLEAFVEAVKEWRRELQKKNAELDQLAVESDANYLASEAFLSKLSEYIKHVHSSYPNALEPKGIKY